MSERGKSMTVLTALLIFHDIFGLFAVDSVEGSLIRCVLCRFMQ